MVYYYIIYCIIEDQMATELLSDGIRRFAKDTEKVEDMLREKL